MNLLHLKYFYTVARENGFTNASRLLHVQQPAISRMVHQLEEHFGFPLFEKIGREVQLTQRGKSVFEGCKLVFSEVDRLERLVGTLSERCAGPLPFGASEPLSSHFVPGIIEKLMPQHPDLYPLIFTGTASTLFEKIEAGELEFGLFFHIPQLPPKLRISHRKKVRFYLVVRKDLKKSQAVMESFIGSREIDDTRTRAFPTLDKLKRLYPKASIKISSNNITAHRALVLRGLGVAVLPDFLIEDDLKKKTVADVLPNEILEFDLKLVERETSVRSINAQTFLADCFQI